MKYLTIKELHHEKHYPVAFLCEVLGCARSAYYKWRRRNAPEKEAHDAELARIILSYHETFNGILGYRRMTLFVNTFNHTRYNPSVSEGSCGIWESRP